MRKFSNKKAIVILCLCIAVIFMATGYAILMTDLNINGTVNINSTWDIRITNIEDSFTVGSAYNIEEPSYTSTTARFNVSLVNPGDSKTYTVTIKNNGTIPAYLSDISFSESGTSAITYTVGGISEGDTLAAGKTATVNVKAEYNQGEIADPSERAKILKLKLTYVQKSNH